jgi:hypothetical protein
VAIISIARVILEMLCAPRILRRIKRMFAIIYHLKRELFTLRYLLFKTLFEFLDSAFERFGSGVINIFFAGDGIPDFRMTGIHEFV